VDQDATWYGGRLRPRRHCVRWGPSHLPQKGAEPPQIFGLYLWWLNGWIDQDGTWHGNRPQPRRLCVRWVPSPLPKTGAEPPLQFSAHVCCGHTAGWIKMALGMKVGLGPGHNVLDGTQLPPQKGAEPPIFGPRLLWPHSWMEVALGCMDQDATWYGGRPRPTRHCVRWEHSSPSTKGAQRPKFRPMTVVVKRWMD